VTFESVCAALEEIPSAGSYLTSSLNQERDQSRRSQDLEFRVRCASRFAPHGASRWLVEHLTERNWKSFCIEQLPQLSGVPGVEALVRLNSDTRVSTEDLDLLFTRALETDAERFSQAIAKWQQLQGSESHETLAKRVLSLDSPLALPLANALLLSGRIAPELGEDLLLFIAVRGSTSDAQTARAVFSTCTEDRRQLAACALFALHNIEGDEAVRMALQGIKSSNLSNILQLLRRHQAAAGSTPSLYKLARELRIYFSSTAQANKDSSL
jgi:hypothetical protein